MFFVLLYIIFLSKSFIWDGFVSVAVWFRENGKCYLSPNIYLTTAGWMLENKHTFTHHFSDKFVLKYVICLTSMCLWSRNKSIWTLGST